MDLSNYTGIDFILISLFTIFVTILTAREIFSISKILRYQKAQTRLLAKIAAQQGVPAEEIGVAISPVLEKDR